jgi:preprotein translocase subunit SecF
MNLQIIKNRKIFLSISALAITGSILALIFWGLNFGVDFAGGSLMEVKFDNYQATVTEVQDSLKEVNLQSLTIQPTQDSVILRFKEDSEEAHQAVLSGLQKLAAEKETTMTELQFDSVGPTVGQELKSKSFNTAVVVLLAIVFYISMAFCKVSRPVASWKYGVTAIIALAHDIIITLGVFSFLGHFYGIEVNTPFIAAILTVLGYSDTIVVFDRIRENLPKSQDNFEDTVNRSINQTMVRSINTSFSSILALVAILFFGGSTIRDFAMALVVGIFVGTYSSIFIASPVLVLWEKAMHRKNS